MASVTLSRVRKAFGNVEVVHGVDIRIEDGEFCVLVGPSGCGKSTLLRMIAGLEEISGGEIVIGERVVNDVAPKQRDIAMVFQNYALYPHMTVFENMGFSLKLAGRTREEMKERVDAAAKILGLTDYLERYPRQLSGGQRQNASACGGNHSADQRATSRFADQSAGAMKSSACAKRLRPVPGPCTARAAAVATAPARRFADRTGT